MVYFRYKNKKSVRSFYFLFLLFYFITPFSLEAQRLDSKWKMDIMAGTSSYNGDLVQGWFPLKRLAPCVGVNIKREFFNKVWVRAGLSYGRIYGDDKKNKDPELNARSLNFKSHIIEFSTAIEYNFLNMNETYGDYYDYTPYFFAGLGVFHFNPYTFDNAGDKVYLKPLRTEGQGLAQFPDRKEYSLYQLCFPIGIGFKWNLNESIQLAYECGYRFTTTDYLDDVSSTYVSLDELATSVGPKSAELSYREQDVPFARRLGDRRGFSKPNDVYFYNVLKVTFGIGIGYYIINN